MRAVGRARGGYTLVELMVVAAISSVVAAGTGSLLFGTYRLSRGALAETEAMLRIRNIRDRLLFRVEPAHDGVCWAGALSGGGRGAEGGAKVLMSTYGIGISDGKARAQQIQLVRHEAVVNGKWSGWLVNENDRAHAGWLHPDESGYLPAVGWLDDSHLAERNLIFLNLEPGIGRRERRTRVAVPVFGKVQPRNSADVFGGR